MEHGEADPKQLLENPLNWRVHPEFQQQVLTDVLDDVGWVQNVIVNKRTGIIVDGHLRNFLALQRKESTIPVVYVDLTDEEQQRILATLDPISTLAAVDRERLSTLMASVTADGENVRKLLSDMAERERLDDLFPPSAADLIKKYGDHDAASFWDELRLKLPPAVWKKYQAIMATMPGKDEHQKFKAMLSRVATDN